MDSNVVEQCGCAGGSLEVLREVQRAYEDRMQALERAPAATRLQMQVDLLRSWVDDLVGQNTLLSRAVEELESEATTRLFLEQRKHSEMVCELHAELSAVRRRLARKDSDLRGLVEVLRRLRDLDYCSLDGIHFFEVTESDIFGDDRQEKKLAQGDVRQQMKKNSENIKNLRHQRKEKRSSCGKLNELKALNESLHKENISKDREIRKLHKDAQQYEQTILNLRNEISFCKYHTPDVTKKDAEVMAGMCCTGPECSDWEPVKDYSSILRDEMASYQERIQKMELNLKSSGKDVRALRKVNVGMREELLATRGVCAALGEQCRAAALRDNFKDEVIREMRRQLQQAKLKLKKVEGLAGISSRSHSLGAGAECDLSCVVSQPRRRKSCDTPRSLSAAGDARSPRLVLSGDELLNTDADHNFYLAFNFAPEFYKNINTSDVTTCTVNIKTSTPNLTRERILVDAGQSPDVSIIENTAPPPILITHKSLIDPDTSLFRFCNKCILKDVPKEPCELTCTHEHDFPQDPLDRTCEIKCKNIKYSILEEVTNTSELIMCKNIQTSPETQRPKPCAVSTKVKHVQVPDKNVHGQGKHILTQCKNVQAQGKHVTLQIPDKNACEHCEELFFNDNAVGSSVSFHGQQVCKCALKAQSSVTLPTLCPTMNLDPKCTGSNVAAKDSVCGSSAAESPSSSCASARAHYYQNKLLATLQILQNKEETVRVQAASLAVAEARIAALSARGAELKKEIDRKGRELQCLRQTLEENKREKVDACVTAQIQEMEDQQNVVKSLQNNLSVIEEFYRECFYETVKQENLIDMLRKSYLDVRLMDKEKSDRICKLNSAINTQKWSLDRCQDIATEVENLKMEISNFLNSSNNDSGMWEESIVGGLNEDLQDISAQLLRLRELLTGDCTCGLEEENNRLKQNNEAMEREMCCLRTRIDDLETRVINKEKLHQEEINAKDSELNRIREELCGLRCNAMEQDSKCDMLTQKLIQTQELLEDKCSELFNVQKKCEEHEQTISTMREQLAKTEEITAENQSLRGSLCASSGRVARLERRLARLQAHCEQVENCYRERETCVVALEGRLEEARARGAALCGEARHVVSSVRAWAARVRDLTREQEEQLNQKDCQLRILQQQLENQQKPPNICKRERFCTAQSSARTASTSANGERQRYTATSSTNEMEATCSKQLTQRSEAASTPGSACTCRARRDHTAGTSASERGSCSTTPVPPKRMLRKKLSPSACGIRARYGWWGPFSPVQRDAGAQHPPPRACILGARAPAQRPVSPGEEMLSRMERLSSALADGCRRWTRRNS